MLWYGLQKYLSWIPLLLLLTILGYLLWNGSVEKVASLVVSYVFIWTVLLGLVEHFLTNAEFCAQAGWLILNSILISAIHESRKTGTGTDEDSLVSLFIHQLIRHQRFFRDA